jgi:hypothetical protein
MNKLILAITLAATVAAVAPANAEPRASSTIQVGSQCFKPTDSARGYGYWTSCDNVYAFAVTRGRSKDREVQGQIERGGGSEGGGGGDGGGGSGGGNR